MAKKFVSWNVNGLRACIKKGFHDFVADAAPDVLCIQECRANPDQVELDLPGYRVFWNPAEKKGYSGTIVLSREDPLHASFGMGNPKHDNEGRLITLEYPHHYLVTVYTPNSGNELVRLAYRTREWDVDFLAYGKGLERSKPVIFCGDLNVAHKEIDLANPQSNHKNAGFTPEERKSFDNILAAQFIDTFREFTKQGGHYTWWSMRTGARERNIGWRLDYFCISPTLRGTMLSSHILPQVMGSDHCPVVLEMES